MEREYVEALDVPRDEAYAGETVEVRRGVGQAGRQDEAGVGPGCRAS
jgi:hypothetical protein